MEFGENQLLFVTIPFIPVASGYMFLDETE